ncbi:hypothetical protein K1I90_05145 [Streptococcus gordonii]|nr:hypothetical protein [Streptococcus gordonii]MBZ2146002.1 hypothetical protein [Streptococcus gordonii]
MIEEFVFGCSAYIKQEADLLIDDNSVELKLQDRKEFLHEIKANTL